MLTKISHFRSSPNRGFRLAFMVVRSWDLIVNLPQRAKPSEIGLNACVTRDYITHTTTLAPWVVLVCEGKKREGRKKSERQRCEVVLANLSDSYQPLSYI